MLGKRIRLATGIVVPAVVLGIGLSPGAALASKPPAWETALKARSQALDKRYRLENYADALAREYHLVSTRTPAGAGAPAWLTALVVRSDALDRAYGLGAYARKG